MDFTFAINKIVKKKEKKILSINKKDQNTQKNNNEKFKCEEMRLGFEEIEAILAI